MTMIDANQSRDILLVLLHDTGQNSLVQELHFLSLILSGSHFIENSKKYSVTENIEKLKTENDTLKNTLKDKEFQLHKKITAQRNKSRS